MVPARRSKKLKNKCLILRASDINKQMTDVSDMELVRQYHRQGSEAAFATLVRRHISLVYSAALRHTGLAAHAEEITQVVFIILARKAASLRPDTLLAGWLYETTRLTSLSFLRGERRRQGREQEVYMQSNLPEAKADFAWDQMSPLLDEALSRLGKKDRDALILRYFKEKNLGEVAAALYMTEAAAQSRAHRALDKLHRHLARRGMSSTAAIMAGELSAHSVHAAPVALAKSVTTAAVGHGAAAGDSTLTIIKGALKLMAWNKMKTTAVVSLGLLLIFAGATAVVVVAKTQSARWQAKTADAYQRGNLNDPNFRPLLTELRDSVWPKERQLAEAKIRARQQTDETDQAVTIDLSPYLNAQLTDSPASPGNITGNNLAALPAGVHVFGGVPFDVAGLIQLDGTNMAMFKKHYPAEVDNIPINRKCAKLYLFHGANWIYWRDFGATVAKLILHYTDGSAREIPIVAGEHVFDFWSPLFTTGVDPRYFQMAPGTERAWAGTNPFIRRIWPDESLILYKSTFDNPQPGVTVSRLDYVSTETGTAPFLVGLTVE